MDNLRRVTKVVPCDDYTLLVTFDNGERRVFDAKQLFDFSAFRPLQNKGFFSCVKVEYGSIVWPQDIDYCSDTLYMQSVPINLGSVADGAL